MLSYMHWGVLLLGDFPNPWLDGILKCSPAYTSEALPTITTQACAKAPARTTNALSYREGLTPQHTSTGAGALFYGSDAASFVGGRPTIPRATWASKGHGIRLLIR